MKKTETFVVEICGAAAGFPAVESVARLEEGTVCSLDGIFANTWFQLGRLGKRRKRSTEITRNWTRSGAATRVKYDNG